MNHSAHWRSPNREIERRQDVYGWDALAWTALKAGELDAARDAAAKATAAGTRDPSLLYHAGMVAKATGDVSRARTLLDDALHIDSRFDPVQAPLARAALADLGRSR